SIAWQVTGSGPDAADAADFLGGILPTGRVTFVAGEASRTITVRVAGGREADADETFSVTLSGAPSGTSIAQSTAVGTIKADNAFPEIVVVNSTTGLPIAAAPTAYVGPVPGVEREIILITPDNINITANSDNWFMHSGSGMDAIAAFGGRNVLDGGTGSNFLVGAAGEDSFFLDSRDAVSDIWSTVVGFGKGDSATVWGISQHGSTITWTDGLGAPGFTGLTIQVSAPGKPNALMTLAGYAQADVDSGKLSVVFGQIDSATPYLAVYGVT
ncbi:MAG: hypothetical protein IT555_21820, partial [Acetobacteraceae bacterium]|nr:hypothetical protein [Acetobacteraceae bacterium]